MTIFYWGPLLSECYIESSGIYSKDIMELGIGVDGEGLNKGDNRKG